MAGKRFKFRWAAADAAKIAHAQGEPLQLPTKRKKRGMYGLRDIPETGEKTEAKKDRK